MEARGMQAEPAHLGPGHAPKQADVERDPGHVVGEHRLRALVETLALDAERQLSGTDQHVIHAWAPVEGQVRCTSPPPHALTRGQRVEKEMRIAAGPERLTEHELVPAGLPPGPRALR